MRFARRLGGIHETRSIGTRRNTPGSGRAPRGARENVHMKSLVIAGAAVAIAFALPAAAQTSSSASPNTGSHNAGSHMGTVTNPGWSSTSSSSSSSTGMTGHTSPIVERLKSELQQSGFKNVRVMPESFLVRAEDKDGHPVMMIVNPDSLTAVTALGTSGNMGSGRSANGTTGSSMGSGNVGSSSSTSTPNASPGGPNTSAAQTRDASPGGPNTSAAQTR